MNNPDRKIFVKENYLFMLRQLRISTKQMREEIDFSESTERRIRNGDVSTISDTTIADIVRYYNKRGAELYPHHVEINEFKYKNLSEYSAPNWTNEQVKGEYVGLYLSRRGTGKVKAMILTIFENENYLLEARAVDTVHDPDKAAGLIEDILSIKDLELAMQTHKEMADGKYSLLRGSHFLHGEVSGQGDLLRIHLKDKLGTYEVTISTSLKSYLNNNNKVTTKYNWRGGATIASVYDIEDWPYSMVVGFTRLKYWGSNSVAKKDIGDALNRMHDYQKKQNMLCLQNDIDALFYESVMDGYRQSEEV